MRNPFVGLRPFDVSEGDLFFGRQREIGVLINHMLTLPVLVVYARSGTGKSSLLNAGVGPRLAEDDSQVPVFVNTAQTDVTLAVKDALIGAGWRGQENLSLRDMLDEHWLKTDRRTIVIIDQFEERLNSGMDHADLFKTISRLVNENSDAACIVISIREDYLGALEPLIRRVPSLLTASYRVPPLSRDAFEEAVYGPLRSTDEAGADANLVAATLADLRQNEETSGVPGEQVFEPGYFQIVWSTLWQEAHASDRNRLNVRLYRRLGGAPKILKDFTNERLAALEPAETQLFWAISRYLVLPTGAKVALTVKDIVLLQKPTDYLEIDRASVTTYIRNTRVWIASLDSAQLTQLARRLLGALTSSKTPIFQRVIREDREEFELLHDILASIILEWRSDFEQAFHADSLKKLRSFERMAAKLQRTVLHSQAPDELPLEKIDYDRPFAEPESDLNPETKSAAAQFIAENTDRAERFTEQLRGNEFGNLGNFVKESEHLLAVDALVTSLYSRRAYLTASRWDFAKNALASAIRRTALDNPSPEVRSTFQEQTTYWALGAYLSDNTWRREPASAVFLKGLRLIIVAALLACIPLGLGNWLLLSTLGSLHLQYTWLSTSIISIGAIICYGVVIADDDDWLKKPLTLFMPHADEGIRKNARRLFIGWWPWPAAIVVGLAAAGAAVFHAFSFAATAGYNVGLLLGGLIGGLLILAVYDY